MSKFISKEDLTSLREADVKFSDLVNNFGLIQIERMQLEKAARNLDSIEAEYKKVYAETFAAIETLRERIRTEFGEGSINMETGEFITE